MAKPLIGITASRSSTGNSSIAQVSTSDSYIQSVQLAGGLPVLIPISLSDDDLDELLPRLDGILIPGGPDIDPAIFNGKPHPEVYGVDTDRDRVELGLIRRAATADKPFFGICRGIQVVNVALGGTLFTHIPDQVPSALRHSYYPGYPREYLAHSVQVQASSKLARILSCTELATNSLHHQGVEQVAPPLQPVAWAPDGLVEAVEMPGKRFALGVQWHPENLQAYPEMRALFRSFVEAAAGF